MPVCPLGAEIHLRSWCHGAPWGCPPTLQLWQGKACQLGLATFPTPTQDGSEQKYRLPSHSEDGFSYSLWLSHTHASLEYAGWTDGGEMRGEPKPGRGANHDPWAKSSLWPIFVNKVLLKQGHAHSLAYCRWLFSDTMELHRKDRHMPSIL